MVVSFVRFLFTLCEESLNSLVRCILLFVYDSSQLVNKIHTRLPTFKYYDDNNNNNYIMTIPLKGLFSVMLKYPSLPS